MKRIAVWVLAAAMAVGLLAGCGSKSTTTTAQPTQPTKASDPQVLNFNIGEEPPSLDSAVATDEVSFDVINQFSEGLVRLGAGGKIVKGSGAAQDWTISQDGLTYTFTLKDGLKWSDGQPLTAKDFAYAWYRALDPKVASQYNYQLFYIVGGEDWSSLDPKAADFAQKYDELRKKVAIKVDGDKSISVTLTHPTPYFLGLMAFPTYFPQRQDVVEKFADKYAADFDKLAFNGPFIVKSWIHESELVLAKNPNYWDAKNVKMETVSFKMVKDSNTSINMFEAGQLDEVGLPGNYIDSYKDKPGYVHKPTTTAWYLEFNLYNSKAKGYLLNQHIRKAFSLALDRQQFVDAVLRNGSEPATTLVPASININGDSFHKLDGDILPKKADSTAAQAELAAGLRELGMDKLPPMDFITGTSDTAKKYTQGIQAMLVTNLPGVTVNLVPLEFKVKLDRQKKGDFDLALAGWGADYDDPNTFMDMWVTGGPYNDPKWTNKNYDELIKKAATADPAARAQAFVDAEKILLDELPIVPLYMPASNTIWRPYVKGVVTFSVGAGMDLKGAYIEGKGQ